MSNINEIIDRIAKGRNIDGSYTRMCYTSEYFEAVKEVSAYLSQLGVAVDVDAAGNFHGILKGKKNTGKSILIGSHLDTVPQGGKFDGAYGVAAAIALVERLHSEGVVLQNDLEIYGFNAEESNPLGGTFGSRALAGLLDFKDPNLLQALNLYGKTVSEITQCQRDFSNVKCYLELHIEQGDKLFNDHLNIGIVTGIVGITRYKVTAFGESNHAGTTMMKNRKDALIGMSKLLVYADECCRAIDDSLVLTIGEINCYPGSANVIPGKVECTFELRHLDEKYINILISKIKKYTDSILGIEFLFEKTINKPGVVCDSQLINLLSKVTSDLGYSFVKMPSGAGHDANPMAYKTAIGMVFVPSVNGKSHCKDEWTELEDLERGVSVLYEAVRAIDKQ